MEILKETLDRLKVAPAQTFAGLTLYPLIGPEAPGPGYRTLDEALEAGVARVTEVSEGGNVPELSFVNDGDRPVLLLDGEELIGAKQNRVLNLTILVPAGKTIVIPVSCVEAGRWASVSREFSSAKHVMFSGGRGRKAAFVSGSLKSTGRAVSNQGEVWDDIADLSRRYGVRSATSKMADVYEARGEQVDDYVKAFRAVDGQVGAVFALGGQLRGVELFDHPQTLSKLLAKLVRSWALDAIQISNQPHEVPPAEAVRDWLDGVAAVKATTHDAAGLGQDVRLTGEQLAGGALVHDGCVVHLCAFGLDGQNGRDELSVRGRIIAASRRQRRRE